jgi:D-threo-aldose 1-dehydrogenase
MTNRTVKLGATGIESTALGFGSANIFRLSSAAQRSRILCAAYDAGIRHFDTAPMYGLGLAEAEVGRFARGRRDSMTIATKFGIAPSRPGRVAGRVQGPIREALEAFPALRNQAREKAAGPQSGLAGALLYSAEGYHPAAARKSLERSLRALDTDYVDVFLLHDPEPGSVRSTDVCSYLEDARNAGLIRTWGIAGEVAPSLRIASGFSAGVPVLQVRDDIWLRSPRRTPRGNGGLITFGVLGAALDRLMGSLAAVPEERARLTELSGADCAGAEAVASLLLAAALRENGSGIVLFSTVRPHRIRQAIEAEQMFAARGQALDALFRLTEFGSDENSSTRGSVH